MNRTTVYTLVLWSLLCLSAPDIEAQTSGTIHGTIKDESTGEGIEFVQVKLAELSVGSVSNEKGSFSIDGIPEGSYTLEFSMLGFTTLIMNDFWVDSTENQDLDVQLRLEQFDLNEITVSATKISKTIKDIGSPVYVIGAEALEQIEGRNIEESLATIPGVFTENRFNGGSNVVSFRGIGIHTHVTRGILVLVDGVPLNETSGRVDFEGVDMENAERIEVIKGPVSSLYGPNGITGVINIIEKEPRSGFHGGLNTYYGSYDTRKIAANVNGGNENLKYLIKSNYIYSGGYQDRQVYDSKTVGVKLSNEFKNHGKLGLTADYIEAYTEYAGPLDSTQYYERSTVATRNYTCSDKNMFRVNLNYRKKIGQHSDLFTSLYNRSRFNEGHYRDSQFGIDDINTLGGEIRWKSGFSLLGKRNTISLGLSADRETGTEELYARDEDTGEIGALIDKGRSAYLLGGIYLQDEFFLLPKLALTLGVRLDIVQYEWEDQFHTGEENTSDHGSVNAVSPKFGLVFHPAKNMTLFGNISKGFNPPQISQLYIGSSYSGYPNPDLDPEFLVNYEVGARGKLGLVFDYQLSIFRMDFRDQIVAEGDPPTYANMGDTRHTGIETSLKFKPTKNLSGHVSYSYLHTEFISDPEYRGNTLRKTPPNQLNTSVQYSFKFGLTASVDYLFLDEYYMDNEERNLYEGHSLVNAKLLYKFRTLYVGFRINNLFDRNYATWAYASSAYDFRTRATSWSKSYYPGLPRNFTISMGINF
ncbi:MAG: TonB-dependent receptor [Bacteroidetes bacterium]|nr:TonB-dependent receptor [Bacteroidota bacterium]